jgi:sugar lactone lactonase YvrE
LGWTSDGHFELFAAEGSFWLSRSSGWRRWRAEQLPTQVTDGEIEFSDRIRVRGKSSFAAVGIDRLGELQKYDSDSKKWRPLLDGVSAEGIEFSRDGRRVVYVSYPQRTLWVSDADGKRPIQITSPPMVVTSPHWSPDSKQIAFTGQEDPSKQTRIYLGDADGGSIRQAAARDGGSQDNASWSPDGKALLFSPSTKAAHAEVYIRSVDLRTGAVTKLIGSEGLFAPRRSPSGDLIAALEWDGA